MQRPMFMLGGSARKNYQSGTDFSELLKNKDGLREGILSDLSELSGARRSRLESRRGLIPLSLLAQQEGIGQIRKPRDLIDLLSALGTDQRTFQALGQLDDIKLKEKRGALEDKLTALKIIDSKDKKFAFEKRLNLAEDKRKIASKILGNKTFAELTKEDKKRYNRLQTDINFLLRGTSLEDYLLTAKSKAGYTFDEDAERDFYKRIKGQLGERELDAEGGRAGFQQGTPDPTLPQPKPVEAVDDRKLENMMEAAPALENPGEVRDMAFNDPKKVYESLRRRLPKEIPDDVVRIIAYNQEAFADFADISDQSDVDSFNEKYNVQLVIPVEEVS
jgi:hypothetical protein